jgi:predicted  nucleic acid-binding Zn-ribbon protein
MAVNAVSQANEPETDNFHSLEEKVYRTIELLKHAREAKAALERDLVRVREQLEGREEELEAAKADNLKLRREREEIRERVEKLVGQIDAIAEASE